MGKLILEYLEGNHIYTCKKCTAHLSNEDARISKAFTGSSGRAFLFDHGVNYHIGAPEEKELITGLHVVCDLMCNGCLTVIGWKYIKAYQESQKYKENKVILERAYLVKIKWFD